MLIIMPRHYKKYKVREMTAPILICVPHMSNKNNEYMLSDGYILRGESCFLFSVCMCQQ